jgi:hypothetical protein
MFFLSHTKMGRHAVLRVCALPEFGAAVVDADDFPDCEQ